VSQTPPRLFVLFARDAPVGVVLRRGPSAWTQVIRWDTARDVFTDGAWLKGRIYEEKCDVSPDGELLVYFCHHGRFREGYTDSWTAVSRVPWLHALALWPSGTTYGGGGRFLDRRKLVLRAGTAKTHPDHPARGLVVEPGPCELQRSMDLVPGADWSGRDHAQRIVYARAGALHRRALSPTEQDTLLIDFNGREPAPVEPPEEAKAPLG
jgi:hypothetical protein